MQHLKACRAEDFQRRYELLLNSCDGLCACAQAHVAVSATQSCVSLSRMHTCRTLTICQMELQAAALGCLSVPAPQS